MEKSGWMGLNRTQLCSIPVDFDELVNCASQGHFSRSLCGKKKSLTQ